MTKLYSKFAAAGVLLLSLVSASSPKKQDTDVSAAKIPVGGELRLCKGCPTFVKVPTAPAGERRIQFVSKYELTWNNYLAAVDAGSCPIPKPYRIGLDAHSVEPADKVVVANLDRYRIDWPIVMLGVTDVECYINWLQHRTRYKVALPTGREWEWFARAGNAGAKFPWGNDPSPRHEALRDTKIASADDIAIPDIHALRARPVGARVGLFAPNAWGIHDLMGNVSELTAEIVTGESWFQQHRDSVLARNTRDKSRVLVKGSDRNSPEWHTGIPQNSYTMIWNGRYSGDVGVRIILSN